MGFKSEQKNLTFSDLERFFKDEKNRSLKTLALWYFAGLAFYFNFKKLSYFMRLVLNNFLTLLLGHIGLYCTKISISA